MQPRCGVTAAILVPERLLPSTNDATPRPLACQRPDETPLVSLTDKRPCEDLVQALGRGFLCLGNVL